jgi:phage-related protein (TIGR01555 family)
MSVEGLRDIIAAGGPAEAGLRAQIAFIRQAQTNEGITVIDAKDTFEAHQYAFAGLSDMLLQFAQQLCGALGMPFTRLFGQSPTGLGATGEGEMKQWHEKVKQNQERRFRNPLHRLFAVMSMSSLGKPLPDDFGFEFRSLQEMSEAEKADIATKKVDAVTKAVDANVQKPSAAMKDLKASSQVTGLFSSITDEDINEAEEQEKNAPPPGEMDLPDVSALTGDSGSAVS